LTANTSTPPPTSPISSIARISPRSINWLLRLRPESLAWASREAEPEADETAAKPWDIQLEAYRQTLLGDLPEDPSEWVDDVVLCTSSFPSETEIEQAREQAVDEFSSDCEVTVQALRDPRMGDDLYATIILI
jgi:hypothetical protein